MSITVAAIFARVNGILQDEDAVRWPVRELVEWYNEGILDMVTRRPDIKYVIDEVLLAAGCEQVVPDNRVAVIDVDRNLGPASAPVNGPIPKLLAKDLMDRLIPGWGYADNSATVEIVVVSPKMPSHYWIYPPQPVAAPGRLKMAMSVRPTNVSEAEVIDDASPSMFCYDDKFGPIIAEYLLYRCFLKDSESPVALQRSAKHESTYLGLLGAGQSRPQQ